MQDRANLSCSFLICPEENYACLVTLHDYEHTQQLLDFNPTVLFTAKRGTHLVNRCIGEQGHSAEQTLRPRAAFRLHRPPALSLLQRNRICRHAYSPSALRVYSQRLLVDSSGAACKAYKQIVCGCIQL